MASQLRFTAPSLYDDHDVADFREYIRLAVAMGAVEEQDSQNIYIGDSIGIRYDRSIEGYTWFWTD